MIIAYIDARGVTDIGLTRVRSDPELRSSKATYGMTPDRVPFLSKSALSNDIKRAS